jgi:hypothetical protein
LGDRQSIKLIADRLLKEKYLTIAPREMDSVVRQTYLPLAALTSSFFTQHCLLMSDYLTSLVSEYKKVRLFSRRYGN